jgi:hypothetical protein
MRDVKAWQFLALALRALQRLRAAGAPAACASAPCPTAPASCTSCARHSTALALGRPHAL